MTGFDFPVISPIAFSIGGFAIRWYSLAYLAGIIAAWFLTLRMIKKYDLIRVILFFKGDNKWTQTYTACLC